MLTKTVTKFFTSQLVLLTGIIDSLAQPSTMQVITIPLAIAVANMYEHCVIRISAVDSNHMVEYPKIEVPFQLLNIPSRTELSRDIVFRLSPPDMISALRQMKCLVNMVFTHASDFQIKKVLELNGNITWLYHYTGQNFYKLDLKLQPQHHFHFTDQIQDDFRDFFRSESNPIIKGVEYLGVLTVFVYSVQRDSQIGVVYSGGTFCGFCDSLQFDLMRSFQIVTMRFRCNDGNSCIEQMLANQALALDNGNSIHWQMKYLDQFAMTKRISNFITGNDTKSSMHHQTWTPLSQFTSITGDGFIPPDFGQFFILESPVSFKFVTAEGVHQVRTTFQVFIYPFQWEAWLALFGTMCFISCCISILNVRFSSKCSCRAFCEALLWLYATLVEQDFGEFPIQVSKESKYKPMLTRLLRITMILWPLVAIVITNGYKGFVKSNILVGFPFESNYTLLDQLTNFDWYIPMDCHEEREFTNTFSMFVRLDGVVPSSEILLSFKHSNNLNMKLLKSIFNQYDLYDASDFQLMKVLELNGNITWLYYYTGQNFYKLDLKLQPQHHFHFTDQIQDNFWDFFRCESNPIIKGIDNLGVLTVFVYSVQKNSQVGAVHSGGIFCGYCDSPKFDLNKRFQNVTTRFRCNGGNSCIVQMQGKQAAAHDNGNSVHWLMHRLDQSSLTNRISNFITGNRTKYGPPKQKWMPFAGFRKITEVFAAPPKFFQLFILESPVSFKFVTAEGVHQVRTTFQVFIHPFQWEAWLGLIGTLCFMACCISLLNVGFLSKRSCRTFYEAFLWLYATLVEQDFGELPIQVNKDSKNKPMLARLFRITMTLWPLVAIVITNGYKGFVKSNILAGFPFESNYTLLDQLTNFDWYIPMDCHEDREYSPTFMTFVRLDGVVPREEILLSFRFSKDVNMKLFRNIVNQQDLYTRKMREDDRYQNFYEQRFGTLQEQNREQNLYDVKTRQNDENWNFYEQKKGNLRSGMCTTVGYDVITAFRLQLARPTPPRG
ncbi:unnamed protein product [Allacma fusca]|uniref:Uncharacterized protein n=1 Tax=Allacma fusca TaxID=39272 RepID=A0A8J2K6L9_9HEXA|nr:unnamed protein product [Allacma fusca]